MTKSLDYLELGKMIHDIFVHADDYRFDKHVPAFRVNDAFLGDFFSKVILEPQGDKPPIFYHTYSPYDVISSKAPGYGAIMEDGELRFSGEITSYVSQRTGVMSPIILKALGVDSLQGKKVLLLGAGRNAQCSLAAFKAHYSELTELHFLTRTSDGQEFVALAESLGITATRGDLNHIEQYDIIICHTNSKQPVLTAEMQPHIKPGAFIAAFVSEDFVEVAEEFYDAATANILIDWEQTASEAPELKAALEHGRAKLADLLRLKEVFSGAQHPDSAKRYTIYRSHGTPMQDMAFLKLLLANSPNEK